MGAKKLSFTVKDVRERAKRFSNWGRTPGSSSARSSISIRWRRIAPNDGAYEFFFVAPPLPVTGAVGSPINPQAIK